MHPLHHVGDPKIAMLRDVPALASLSARTLRRVARLLDVLDVAPGRTLTRPGRPAGEFFVVAAGTAAVEVDGRQVRTLGRGDLAGDVGALARAPRDATVRALTRMRVLVGDPRSLDALRALVPALGAHATGDALVRAA